MKSEDVQPRLSVTDRHGIEIATFEAGVLSERTRIAEAIERRITAGAGIEACWS